MQVKILIYHALILRILNHFEKKFSKKQEIINEIKNVSKSFFLVQWMNGNKFYFRALETVFQGCY